MSTHPTAKLPEELRPYVGSYFPDSWREMSLQELGSFVHLLTTRSLQRGRPEKRAKDLYDARNYWRMMGAHLDAHELDAESHAYSFGKGAAPSLFKSPEELAVTAAEGMVFSELNPPGDMEQQESPAGDVDLMGEVDETPDTTPETEFERHDPITGSINSEAPSEVPTAEDREVASVMEQVREALTPKSNTETRRPRRSRTQKGSK